MAFFNTTFDTTPFTYADYQRLCQAVGVGTESQVTGFRWNTLSSEEQALIIRRLQRRGLLVPDDANKPDSDVEAW